MEPGFKSETPDWVYRLCLEKCTKHGINFIYVYKKMEQIKPQDEQELLVKMNEFIGWSFWNNYTVLLYPSDMDKQREEEMKQERAKRLN